MNNFDEICNMANRQITKDFLKWLDTLDEDSIIRIQQKEIEKLHSIINEAINKTNDIEFRITGKDFSYYLKLKDIEQGKELLQILKGSDKE